MSQYFHETFYECTVDSLQTTRELITSCFENISDEALCTRCTRQTQKSHDCTLLETDALTARAGPCREGWRPVPSTRPRLSALSHLVLGTGPREPPGGGQLDLHLWPALQLGPLQRVEVPAALQFGDIAEHLLVPPDVLVRDHSALDLLLVLGRQRRGRRRRGRVRGLAGHLPLGVPSLALRLPLGVPGLALRLPLVLPLLPLSPLPLLLRLASVALRPRLGPGHFEHDRLRALPCDTRADELARRRHGCGEPDCGRS